MSLIDDAKSKLGELIITGFEGTELTEETAAFLSQAKIGGVLLFAPNYKDPEQVARLISEVQECRSELPLWVSVDQEGGRVQRFKAPYTIIPPASKLGLTDSPKLAFEIAEMMAKELKAVGVNLNFNPVADILTNPKNPVIGDRAYSADEDIVSKMVTAMCRGHLVGGVQPCVKHFPGHGDTHVDSHFALPAVETPLEALREREFRPFVKAFKSRCAFVMTAHIINPTIDPKYPATLSEKTLKGVLRQELRYTKIIVSDDLEMQAITDHYGAEDAPRMALQAGCDLLIYRTEKAARHAYQSLANDLEAETLDPAVVLEAAQRSIAQKKEALHPYKGPDFSEIKRLIGCAEHKAMIERLG
jgi:beta-N-acetylhexosaminidase